jgi:hypothetical protein
MRPLDLLAGAIDYAGLFPPAALGMEEAVRNYAAYLRGDDAWALGRFVVPVARLEELIQRRETMDDDTPWRLSALAGASPVEDAARILEFNDAHAAAASIEAIEARATTPEDVAALQPLARVASELYVEIPPDERVHALVRAVRSIGARAKIRTGGTTEAAFPDAASVLRFLIACRDAGVAFKATAGLHHAVRGSYPLTYASDAALGTMYGYLNVLLAAILLWGGGDEREARALLEEREASAIRVQPDGITWRGLTFPNASVRTGRSAFASGFGSCSFEEPLEEIRYSFAA